MLQRVTACALGATLLAACASSGTAPTRTGQQESLARYEAFAGPPVQSFTWFGRLFRWEPLGRDRVVVFTSPGEAYLLRIWPPCDMRFVSRMRLSSTSGRVFANLDSVLIQGGSAGVSHCPISEIRPVDMRRMRAETG